MSGLSRSTACRCITRSAVKASRWSYCTAGPGVGADWELIFKDPPKDYRLVVPDLRGHGRSTNPSLKFTIRQSALDVFALLDQLEVDRFKLYYIVAKDEPVGVGCARLQEFFVESCDDRFLHDLVPSWCCRRLQTLAQMPHYSELSSRRARYTSSSN